MMGVGNGIYGAQLSPAGDRLVGQPVRLTVPNETWEQGVTEGPDIVRDGDTYVLVYSGGHCCRPPCTYAVGVARSANILGPYSKDPSNPVFHGGNGWKCPGHGTLVDGPDGSLTFLHHAYESDDPFDVHRQALLDPVVFGADGWPVFGEDGAPIASDTDEDALSFVDVFAGHALAPGWQWPYDGPPDVVVRGGLLHIRSGQVSRAWVPRNFVAEADIRGRGRLTMLLTDGRQVGVSAARRSVAAISGLRTIARAPIDATAIALHVRSGQAVGAYARRPGGRWARLGPPVLAPRGAAVDRVVLSRGTYGEVRLRPLGHR
jgi:hypothetical protein